MDSNIIFASLIKGRESKTLSRIIMLEDAVDIVLPEEAETVTSSVLKSGRQEST